ncbi:MAG: tRNA pseudouridine(55) synthase TruB [Candidatus Saccharimonadales bacterium]
MQGLLLVDKPVGWTSFDVVNYIRRIVANELGKKPKNVKVGHTGTLDPFATGLLVVLIGKEYTKKAAELSKVEKTYELTALLGETSTTGDPEGELKHVSEIAPALIDVEKACRELTGVIQQTPPSYSAIKVNGKRSYELAREGKEVKLNPRAVTIHNLKIIEYSYPVIKMTCSVSSGTYIRSLVESIGEKLGTGAYTSALRRTQVGDYSITDALDVKSITTDTLTQHLIYIS